MSALPARPHHEPEENEAQVALLLDALVDQVDDAIGRAIKHGLGEKVREIVLRRMPELGQQATGSGQPAAEQRLGAEEINVLIGILHATAALDEHARRAKPDSPAQRRDAACRDFLRLLSDRVKSGAVTVNVWEV